MFGYYGNQDSQSANGAMGYLGNLVSDAPRGGSRGGAGGGAGFGMSDLVSYQQNMYNAGVAPNQRGIMANNMAQVLPQEARAPRTFDDPAMANKYNSMRPMGLRQVKNPYDPASVAHLTPHVVPAGGARMTGGGGARLPIGGQYNPPGPRMVTGIGMGLSGGSGGMGISGQRPAVQQRYSVQASAYPQSPYGRVMGG